MTEIQGGRWDRLLARLFPVKGGTIAPSIAPELQPVVQVQTFEPEMYYLKGEKICWSTGNVAASVGNFSVMHLENPAGSNVLGIIEAIELMTTTNRIQYIGIANAAHTAAASNGAAVRDTRWPGGGTAPSTDEATVQLYSGAIAAIISSAAYTVRTLANESLIREIPIVLGPGMTLEIRQDVVNADLRASFVWRERSFELSEA